MRVMGYSWEEVHDEAELLEHVVTDRLIDRIDEMGRPETDPHGDPIPNAEGLVKPQDAQTLLSCPLETTVTVTRAIDQDKEFLRFIEHNHLKPGEAIEVEARDAAADSVVVRGKNDQRITIGTRARRRSCWCRSRCRAAVSAAAGTRKQQPRTEARRTNLSGYMDFHFNKEEFTDARSTFIGSSCWSRIASRRIRFVRRAGTRTRVRRGPRGCRRTRARTGLRGLSARSLVQRSRGHAADADWHHQRTARAAGLLRRGAAIHRRSIIPTTWFEVGAGVHGEIGRGWRYRGYVTAPLNAAEFTADEGIREVARRVRNPTWDGLVSLGGWSMSATGV